MSRTAPSFSMSDRCTLPFVEGNVKSMAASPTSGMRSAIGPTGPPVRIPRYTVAVRDTDGPDLWLRPLPAPTRSCEDRTMSQEIPFGPGFPDPDPDATCVAQMVGGSTEALAAL